MPKASTFVAVIASTAAAGLGGAVIAGAADNANGTTPGTTPGKGEHRHGGPGPGGGGPLGLRGGPDRGETVAAIAKALGVTKAQLNEALKDARPTPPTEAERDAKRDERAAAIAKELGESTADVKAVIESVRPDKADRPKKADKPKRADKGEKPAGPPRGERGPGRGGPGFGPGGRGPGGPGGEKLAEALAKKFSITEAKAKAALDAVRAAAKDDHEDRAAERYAAIAKALGKDAAEVKKAFEDNVPARPGKPGSPAPTTPAPTTP